jgi:3-oxocholest-4-en-26-oyl-CoA dehydrogenase beta subunit
MDFNFTPDQDALRDLARQIISDRCTNAHLKSIAATDSATDLDLWRALGKAGLVGIGLPESVGGGGYGWLETAIVLSEIGRAAAPLPAFAVMALAAPALVDHPDLLDGVTDGSSIVTAALHEPVGDPLAPAATVADGRLSGTKVCVPHGLLAARFVVSAADGLFVVEATAPGVTIERQDTTSGVPDAFVVFDEAPARRIGDSEAVAAIVRRGLSAATVVSAALCEEAVRLTAEYAIGREQFDKPIASFQAVSQRVGDAYIDTEAVRLTAWQAAWRLDHGLDADEALLSAKFWSAEGGWRVVHAAQHVHGGVGADRDYPLHRYFLLHKQLELTLGSATPTLARLGRLIAD